MHKTMAGISLIEVVMILVIVGLICAAAVPRYVEESAMQAAQDRQLAGETVKSAMVLAVADKHMFPTVSELTAYVQAKKASAEDNAVVLLRNNSEFRVPTYSDSACRQPTASVNDRVQCVGSAR